MASKQRELKHSDQFERQYEEWGGESEIEPVLRRVFNAISMNADVFPSVARGYRLAKTRRLRSYPAFRILFKIVDASTVELVALEATEDV